MKLLLVFAITVAIGIALIVAAHAEPYPPGTSRLLRDMSTPTTTTCTTTCFESRGYQICSTTCD